MRGVLAALAAFTIWSLSSTVFLRSINLPGPIVTNIGMLVAAVGALVIIGPKRWREIPVAFVAHPFRLISLAATFGGCSLTYQWAVKTTTVANAALTHALQPALTVVIFAPLFLKERPDKKGIVSLVLGFAGLAVLLWPQLNMDGSMFGIVLGLLSAVFFSLFNIQLPFFGGKEKNDVVLFWNLALSAVMLLPFSTSIAMPVVEVGTMARAVAFGLVNYLFTNLLFYYALNNGPVGRISTLAYIEPVIAILAAAAFLSEPLTAAAFAGGALVIASGVIVVFGGTLIKKIDRSS